MGKCSKGEIRKYQVGQLHRTKTKIIMLMTVKKNIYIYI